MRTEYKIVKNWHQLKTLIGYIKETGIVSLDFETTDTAYFNDSEYVTVLGLSFQPGSAWVVPLGHFQSPFKYEYENVLRYIGREIISNPAITKIGWNWKFEYKWFLRYDIIPLGRLLDGMLAKYLLDEERPMGLKDMVRRYLPEFGGYELPGSGSKTFNWSAVPLDTLCKYCAGDCDFTFRITLHLENKLIDNGFYGLYRNLMMMMVRVLGRAEFEGFPVDEDWLLGLVDKYERLIKENEEKIRSSPIIVRFNQWLIKDRIKKYVDNIKKEIEELEDQGKDHLIKARRDKITRITLGNAANKKEEELFLPVNFGSPLQMASLFYDSPAGFQFEAKKFGKNGNASTDEESLEALKQDDDTGFIDMLLNDRALKKLYSTYIIGIGSSIDSNNRLHCSYLLHGTVTGRLSSTEPNMQNIPRVTTNPDIRRIFLPSQGKLLVSVDYSQAELRVVAELSADEAMIEMFNTGVDIHLATACRVNNVSPKDIAPILKNEDHPDHLKWIKLRKRAKRISFGILYGQSANKLATGLSEDSGEFVSKEKAQKFLDDWFKAFPKIQKWIKKQNDDAIENAYVRNIFGRKRRLHVLNDPMAKKFRFGEYLEALRQSVNAPIQGAASDFTQLTGIVIYEEKLRGNIPESVVELATIHDENVFEVCPEDIHTFVKRAIEIGTSPDTGKFFGFEMKHVKMKLDAEVGYNFGEMHDYSKDIDYIKFYNDGLKQRNN